jgi:predicted RNase H-like nuclease (RuvC/YqgF family)
LQVESYKAENHHWLSQLNDTQREHMELRTRISEQKAQHIKHISDKDAIIEQLRSVIHNLKVSLFYKLI